MLMWRWTLIRTDFCLPLQTQSYDGTGSPLVLIDNSCIIIVDGVVHHQSSTGKVTLREVVYDGDTLVENHVEAHVLGYQFLIIEG